MPRMLVYDTETSGLPLWREPSSHPDQPHLVSIAAALVDCETRRAISSLNLFVKAEGWEIEAEAARVHGISVERSQEIGIAERTALSTFIQLWRCADFRVAHNEPFDMRIVRIALSRYESICDPDVWKAGAAECTQRLAKPICALPPTGKMMAAGRMGNKAPNLGEAYRFFTGKTLEGAHNALHDLRACMLVYWGCQDHAAGGAPVQEDSAVKESLTAPTHEPAAAAASTTSSSIEEGLC